MTIYCLLHTSQVDCYSYTLRKTDTLFYPPQAWGSASADFGNAYVSDVGEGGAVFVDGGSLFVARSKGLSQLQIPPPCLPIQD